MNAGTVDPRRYVQIIKPLLSPLEENSLAGRGRSIRLKNAIFIGPAGGTLGSIAFATKTLGNVADPSDRIIHDGDIGRQHFDRDGTGLEERVHFATLATGLSLTNADFFAF
jgi:Ca2+-binding RTX toxin-like protein